MRKSVTTAKKILKKFKEPIFKVGDTVKFRATTRDAYGRITEDRGAIGVGGRRLYRVLYSWDDVDRETELPEEYLQAVAIS